jgi:hypothetical protein
LQQTGIGLSDNYLKVELAQWRQPNQITDVRVGAVTTDALREAVVQAV